MVLKVSCIEWEVIIPQDTLFDFLHQKVNVCLFKNMSGQKRILSLKSGAGGWNHSSVGGVSASLMLSAFTWGMCASNGWTTGELHLPVILSYMDLVV